MERKKLNRSVGILAGFGLLYYAVLRGVNAIAVGVRGYQFAGLNLTEHEVSVRLFFYIKNPLLVGVKLKGIYGDVYMQGIKVGYINSAYDYFLSGRRTHIVPVTVTCDITSLGEAVALNIQSGDIKTLTVAFDGSIVVGKNGNVSLPVQRTMDWREIQKW